MPYIDLRVEFEEEVEDFGDGDALSYFTPMSVRTVSSDISESDRSAIGEFAGQSDRYTVDVANAMLSALGDDKEHSV